MSLDGGRFDPMIPGTIILACSLAWRAWFLLGDCSVEHNPDTYNEDLGWAAAKCSILVDLFLSHCPHIALLQITASSPSVQGCCILLGINLSAVGPSASSQSMVILCWESLQVEGIFGFCDIRNFTDCCEVLQAETMLFTNRIANIVHELVEVTIGQLL
eukprot:4731983-Amphidinium_carterae.2